VIITGIGRLQPGAPVQPVKGVIKADPTKQAAPVLRRIRQATTIPEARAQASQKSPFCGAASNVLSDRCKQIRTYR
jgi:hypothetical protein